MIKDFVDTTLEVRGQGTLEDLLGEFSESFNLKYASYIGCCLSEANPGPVALSNFPKEWVEFCNSTDLDACDPVFFETKDRILPYAWDGDLDAKMGSKEVSDFFEVARDFGTRESGLAIPVRGPRGDKGLVSLVAYEGDGDWGLRRKEQVSELIYFAQAFHTAVVETEREKAPEVNSLTERERVVLTWAARGKTAWETGKIIGLSEGTVKAYTREACAKLGVSSKIEAIARCIATNKISL